MSILQQMTSGKATGANFDNVSPQLARTGRANGMIQDVMNRVTDQLAPITKKMYDSQNPLIPVFNFMEKITGAKREHVVYTISLLLAVYTFSGSFIQLISNIAGFIYPFYVSLKVIRSLDRKDETKQWLVYWMFYSLFSISDLTFARSLPFYYLLKMVFLMYLYLPQFDGANVVFRKFVEPICKITEDMMKGKPKDH